MILRAVGSIPEIDLSSDWLSDHSLLQSAHVSFANVCDRGILIFPTVVVSSLTLI